jgi:hypothetical protein
MSSLARRSAAAVGLAFLLGGLGLPLLGPLLAGERAPFCCGKGRCCCTEGATATADERPCLRRGCGCETGDAVVAGAPLRIEAVLPRNEPPARPGARLLKAVARATSPVDRPHAPAVPPPRRPLPA